MVPSRKLLVVGLDGFTERMLRPMIRRGAMPTLERLLGEGTCATLVSSIPPITAPAWTTLATGANPGRHRIFSFFRAPDGTDRMPRLNDSSDVALPSFWNYLSDAGISTGVSHVPVTYPPRPLRGFMVCPHPSFERYEIVSQPRELAAEVASRVPISRALSWPHGMNPTPEYLSHLIRCLGQQQAVDVALMQASPWECFFSVIAMTDAFQHVFWRFVDPAHRDYDAAATARFGGLLDDFYRAVDGYIAALAAEAGPEASVLVLSDHGFGPYEKLVNVNHWLEERGVLRLQTNFVDRVRALAARHGITADRLRGLASRLDVWHLWSRMAPLARQRLREGLERGVAPRIDWQRSDAVLRYAFESAVFLRPEARARIGELRDQLADLRDPENGERIFESVRTREELYVGPEIALAPDLYLQPREGYLCSNGLSSGSLIESHRAGRLSGFHRMEGVLVASGPAFRRVEAPLVLQLADVAPTILRFFGLGTPAAMDGRPIEEMFSSPTSTSVGAATAEGFARSTTSDPSLSDAEETEVRHHLESLGYI